MGVGQVDREVADLRQDELAYLATAEFAVQIFAFAVGSRPRDEWDVEALVHLPKLPKVLADDQNVQIGILFEQASYDIFLGGVLAGDAVLVAPLGDGVFHA